MTTAVTSGFRRGAPALLSVLAVACSKPVELVFKHDLGVASRSTPLVTEDFVAVGSETGLHILDLDGNRRCAFDVDGEVLSRPVTDGTRIFFGSTDYFVYAIDTTCQQVWRFATRDRVKSDPWVDAQGVIVSSYDGTVYALRADSGRLRWRFPKAGTPEVGDFSYSAPTVALATVFVGNLDHHLYALNSVNGALRWRFRTEGPVTSSPRVVGTTVYFGSQDGNIYAVNTRDGQARWKFSTHDGVLSSPRLTAGDPRRLYIGSNDRGLYAVDATSGTLVWRFALRGPAVAVPAVLNNLVIAAGGSGDGALYAVDQESQNVFWRYDTGGGIESDPVVVGDRVYVSSTDQHVYAFRFRRTRAD